jgi:hypothetical protein
MRTRVLLALTLLASAVACKSSTSPSPAYLGSYTLTRYNGNVLPYTQTLNGASLTLNSGTANLLANGTWSVILTITPSIYSSSSSGTYTVSGSTITFTDTVDGSKETGTFSNNVITIVTVDSPPQTIVFTKIGLD